MHVLVADAEGLTRALLTEAVESLGHDCTAEGNGLHAWEAYLGEPADAVIAGLDMPGMDGPELCRRIRGHRAGAATYLVVLHAPDGAAAALDCVREGADDHLRLPIDPVELDIRVAAAARGSSLRKGLVAARRQVEELARVDGLTGVGNRRRLEEDLGALRGRVERYGHSYSLALCEVDDLDACVASGGLAAADDLLTRVARCLGTTSRSGDSLYRYDEERFALLFPEQDLQGVATASERMRIAVEEMAAAHPGRESGAGATVTLGVARLGKEMTDPAQLLLAAEEALAAARAAGANVTAVRRTGGGHFVSDVEAGLQPRPG